MLKNKILSFLMLPFLALVFFLAHQFLFSTVSPVSAASVGLNLDQCQNGTLANLGTACAGPTSPKWANGDVNGSNSQYREGDGLPYRNSITGLGDGTWTIRVDYDFTKGGKFALDRLTKYNLTQASDPCANTTDLTCTTSSPSFTFVMPSEVVIPGATQPQLPNSGALKIAGDGTLSSDAQKSMSVWADGGSPVFVSTGQNDTGSQSTSFNDNKVKQNGLSSGDSDREFAFKVTLTGCPTKGCNLMMGWTGHIASSETDGNGGWGVGNGASFITGAPFHMRIVGVDNTTGTSGGNQDRSVQLSAIVSPSTITIHKVTSPAGGTGFGYTTTGGLSPATFSLNDGGSISYSPAPGSYTVVENDPAPSYALTNLVCGTATGTGTTATTNQGTRTVSITIGAGGGGNVDCTFTNTLQQAHLTLVKLVTNDNGGTKTISDFPLTATGPTTITGVSGTGNVTNAAVNAGTYTLSETTQTGYTPSLWTCTNGTTVTSSQITLAAGQSTTCTVTNNDNPPALHLRKTVTNDSGGTATATDWTLSATGTGGSPSNLSGSTPVDSGATFKPDTYSLAESGGPANYTAGAWNCGGATMPDATHVTVPFGGDVTCTINNNDNAAHLIVVKHVVNDNGGTKVASDFSTTISGVTTVNPTAAGAESPGVDNVLTSVGSYSVDEGTHVGYDKTLSADCSGTISLGQTKTCTIINDDIQPKLTLTKIVVNDNGGTAVVSDFPLFVSGTKVASGVQNGFNAGSYTASETNLTGYTAGNWTGDCAANGTVALVVGDVKSCTITNNDTPPALHLRKTVTNDNGGSALNTAWTLTATGQTVSPTNLSGSTPVDSGANFKADTYALAESGGPSGYAAGSWNCVGGTMGDATHVTVALGQSATCTINNNDVAPTLKLVKVVTNDNGGTAAPADWNLTATGDVAGFADAGNSTTFHPVTANQSYVLSESGLAGYAQDGNWVCDGGNLTGSTITLDLAQNVTCTVTNNDIAPTLKLVKTVTNDNGGSNTPHNWTLIASGTAGFSDLGDSLTFHTVNANVGYVLSESTIPGYTAGSWSCDGGNLVGSTITLALNNKVTCTINNDDQAAHLIVIKHVINNNGGTKVAGDFSTTITGVTTANPTAVGVESPGVDNILTTVGSYSVDEGAHDGYDKTLSADCSGTIALGQTKTCTITNDDQPPALHLRKIVINDNGGKALATDWTLSAAGTTPLSGNTPVDSEGNFSAGTYALSESGPTGYTPSDWVCVGGVQGDTTHITLGLGQSATCTITNNDNPPALHLRKTVTNDNGGNASAIDWTLVATGSSISPTNLTGVTPVDSDAGFRADTYTLSENNGPAGYAAGPWNCVGDVTNTGNSITMGIGQSATCTINNNDIAPSLKLIKVVNNNFGGTSVPHDWTLGASGDVAAFTVLGDSTTFHPVTAGFNYALSESGPSGYASQGWSCDGGILNVDHITLTLAQNVTCTATNNDIQPKLKLIKHVVNDNGGTLGVSDFPLFVGTTLVTSGTTNGFNAGSYTATETSNPTYAASVWSGDCAANGSVTLGVGDNKTCEITNNDIPSTVTIVKVAQPKDCQDFAFTFTGQSGFSLDDDAGVQDCTDANQPQSKQFNFLNAGNYTVAETEPNSFWTLGGITCVNSGDKTPFGGAAVSGTSVTLNLGLAQDVTCTFVNTKQSPTRTLGFWQTHTAFTTSIFLADFAGGMQIGTAPHKGSITNTLSSGQSQLFGAFYANIAKTSTGAKRDKVGQARMQLLQQLVAAQLNCAAFGCSPSINTLITTANTDYFAGNANTILTDAGLLGAYNTSGDTIVISPPLPIPGNATPTTSKLDANISFWDNP